MPDAPRLPRELFAFLRELADNNDRDWFQANRARYREHVQEPLLEFIAAFSEPLAGLSPEFVADPRPTGGSMFRIHRDVRFSKDKRPYKTHAAAQFRHRRGRDVHAPGFYLHLEPDNVFAGAGMWHPDGAALKAVRDAIVESPDAWTDAIGTPSFRDTFELQGDSLTRTPRGYDPDHPLIEDLRRKDFVAMRPFRDADALSPRFLETFNATCRTAAPMVRFLTRAVGLEY